MNNPVIVDLGCGKNKVKGAIGVDNVKLETVDIVHDLLDFPYPFEKESVDKVILSHVLEHFRLDEIIKILNEVGRILKTNGTVIVSVPHVFSVGGFLDPGHKSFFTYATLYYFTKDFMASYRRDLQLKNNWKIRKIWTSVNIFNNTFSKITKSKQRLCNFISRIFNIILIIDKSLTLAEIAVKFLPCWIINIHAEFYKKD